jgi:site-specific DNA-methyltransferase (adenine-specific)
MTPVWVAEALIDRHFRGLDASDVVIEPSCGQGSFLRSFPATTTAFGVEIDPMLADVARTETGREVITGDFRTVPIDLQPTAIIGNPPFQADVIDGFLDRAWSMLPVEGRVGFILPTYLFQTAGRVMRYTDKWSLFHELLPRNAFHARMQQPLLFAIFSKDSKRTLIGFALYPETDQIMGMAKPYRHALAATRGSVWKTVCAVALNRLGGSASLNEIYQELQGNRPTANTFWREKVRQTLRLYSDVFSPVSTGLYSLKESV